MLAGLLFVVPYPDFHHKMFARDAKGLTVAIETFILPLRNYDVYYLIQVSSLRPQYLKAAHSKVAKKVFRVSLETSNKWPCLN